jgi:hypothetical protein
MTSNAKIALNPLPWVLTEKGFELSVPVLRQAFSEIATTPFKAIHADPPEGMTPAQYRALLAEYGLVPAPATTLPLSTRSPPIRSSRAPSGTRPYKRSWAIPRSSSPPTWTRAG